MEKTSEIVQYLNWRAISSEMLEDLQTEGLISFHKWKEMHVVMKDLNWTETGIQKRGLPWNGLKSKTASGGKVSFFYRKLDSGKPIIISEGEVDTINLCMYCNNVIWLQGVQSLKKLVMGLQKKGAKEIYLLIDSDDAWDSAISQLINTKWITLSWIYDSRGILWKYNDVNSMLSDWKPLDESLIIKSGKKLDELVSSHWIKADDLIVVNGFGTASINHEKLAKYIVNKYDIAWNWWTLFHYNNDIWKPIYKQRIEQIIIQEIEEFLSEHIEEIRNSDKNNTYDFIITHAENSDIKERLHKISQEELNLENGILDIKTMIQRPYTKADYKFHKLPYHSDILTTTKLEPIKWLKFLGEILDGWLNKEQILDFLQEFVGYLLIPSTKFEKSLLLYWLGSNGKWVLLDVIKEVVWRNQSSSVGLHEIIKEQNLALLFGKLLNIDSDMQQGVQLDSWIIKKIISGESIVWKEVFQKPICFSPYVRILVATNELPYLKGFDDSIRRRFVFLELKNSFINKQNHNLKEELKQEKNEIFARAIQGLKRLLERNYFIIPQVLTKELDRFIKESDSVEMFLESGMIFKDFSGLITNSRLYCLYSDFSKQNGFRPLSLRKLWDRLKNKWFERYTDGHSRGFEWLSEMSPTENPINELIRKTEIPF